MNENVFRKYVLKNNDEIIKDLKSGVLLLYLNIL